LRGVLRPNDRAPDVMTHLGLAPKAGHYAVDRVMTIMSARLCVTAV
jgi:hypothetical protein